MMRIVGPTYMAKPRLYLFGDGDWCCTIIGHSLSGHASTPKAAYDCWREEVQADHAREYAHDPEHHLYFPGDPEWADFATLKRIEKALQGPRVEMPVGLSTTEKLSFINGAAAAFTAMQEHAKEISKP
jgi:hypothetical protein